MEQSKFEIYSQYRSHLLAARQSNFESLDRAILTLSSGGLGLSLAFIKDVVAISHLTSLTMVIFSWALFGISILSTLCSFLVSQSAIDRQIQHAEEYYIEGKDDSFNKRNVLTTITEILNKFSALCFMLAVAFTIYFVSVNVSKESATMSDQEKGHKVRLQDAYEPPRMQKVTSTGEEVSKAIPPARMPKEPQQQPTDSNQGDASPPPPKESGDK